MMTYDSSDLGSVTPDSDLVRSRENSINSSESDLSISSGEEYVLTLLPCKDRKVDNSCVTNLLKYYCNIVYSDMNKIQPFRIKIPIKIQF